MATFPRDVNGAVKPGPYRACARSPSYFRANLKVVNNKLVAVRDSRARRTRHRGRRFPPCLARPATRCTSISSIDFFIADTRKARCRSSPARNFGSKSPFRPKARRARFNWRSSRTALGSRWRFSRATCECERPPRIAPIGRFLEIQASPASFRSTNPSGSAISTRLAARSILRR